MDTMLTTLRRTDDTKIVRDTELQTNATCAMCLAAQAKSGTELLGKGNIY